jgi:hypothetical protein
MEVHTQQDTVGMSLMGLFQWGQSAEECHTYYSLMFLENKDS